MNNQDQKHDAAVDQYVIFKLDGESYGVSIHFVEIIEKVTDITRVPNAQPYILGVINLRGEIVPVIDLRKLFGLESIPVTDDSRIIILSVEELTVGIMTDSSSEVLSIPQENIENATSVLSHVEETSIKGIGKIDDRMIIMLDVFAILGLNDQESSEERSQEH
ncbi:chemotaxis protein CheW [Anoxynatronum buryatiense]|uniref:Purine-binding chemotaxis protein CheW n=1 Tax=Anoxynatronum buryatiense TaxID=489973 RepID=A0AA45WUD2_9CLOT|nr:chemotaxis protein CheW [Anoxynatronum buryatiense]SMP47403.1 purine-binding chemotaxis protein CheW [Anoxynatronum buryatiense]